MNVYESLSDSPYEQQVHLAKRELFSFIAAIAELYGPEQAGLSADDWLNELELLDTPPRFEACNWRSVTIAASARLASRVRPPVVNTAPLDRIRPAFTTEVIST